MRMARFLSVTFVVTMVSLLYVYQQTEIFRLAYVEQKRAGVCQDLLDKNAILRYNIETNASLTRISDKIAQCADFQMPDNCRLVKVASPKTGFAGIGGALVSKENVFARFFGVKQQAEARTINP